MRVIDPNAIVEEGVRSNQAHGGHARAILKPLQLLVWKGCGRHIAQGGGAELNAGNAQHRPAGLFLASPHVAGGDPANHVRPGWFGFMPLRDLFARKKCDRCAHVERKVEFLAFDLARHLNEAIL